MKILFNYIYEYAPVTTAYYLEEAAKRNPSHSAVRRDCSSWDNCDFVINTEPVNEFIKLEDKPTLYYEIDNHVIRGKDRHFYDYSDVVVLAQNKFKPHYTDYKTFYLPLGFDEKIHKPMPEVVEEFDIGFIGNLTYPRRKRLFDMLSLNFKTYHAERLFGEDYTRALNRCKIIFNCAMDNDVNMRFFEALGIGKLLMTDHLLENREFGKPDEHFVEYNNGKDLIEKVQYYLDNEEIRNKIAIHGHKYALNHHTYTHRLNTLIEFVQNNFKVA